MLVVCKNGKSVIVSRDEEGKSYSSSDVPSGTDSVIYRSAIRLKEQGVILNPPLPKFTESQNIDLSTDDKKDFKNVPKLTESFKSQFELTEC